MKKVYEYGPDKRRFIISPGGTNSLHVYQEGPFDGERITVEIDEEEGNYAADIGDDRHPFPTVGAAVEAACKHLAAQEDRGNKLRNGMATFVDGLEDESPF